MKQTWRLRYKRKTSYVATYFSTNIMILAACGLNVLQYHCNVSPVYQFFGSSLNVYQSTKNLIFISTFGRTSYLQLLEFSVRAIFLQLLVSRFTSLFLLVSLFDFFTRLDRLMYRGL